MVFQFIRPERNDFIKEVKNNYLKEDGIALFEEKFSTYNEEVWLKNERKKNQYKSMYYSQAELTQKQEEVLVGMKGDQTYREEFLKILNKEFTYVEEYWDSGNFKGYLATDSKAKRDQFLAKIGGRITSEYSEDRSKPRFSVGFVQTKQKPEGTQITLSNVDDQIQGKGVGTQMYKQAATEAVSKGGTLISDFNNKGAEGVWSKLREQGLTEPMTMGDKVVERIKTTPDSFDINGEPSVSDVITYIQSKNYEGQTLSDVEANEVRNVMLGTTMTSSEELFRALKRAFTPNGMYNPSEQSLMASGVYSKVEARRLLDSEELQLTAYEMMHKLKNSDTVLNESEVDNKYITVTSSFNSLGTLRKSNPYINKKNATEILGGIKNETSFYNQAEANDLDFANTKFEELSKLTKLNKTKIEGGRTRTETNLDTLRTRLEETLTLPSDNKLTKSLNYLLETPNDVWNLEFKNVRTILEDIETNAVDIGLDLSNLNEEAYDKTPAEVKSLLNSVRNFSVLQNESTFEILLGEYTTFFDMSEAPTVATLDLNKSTAKKTLVYSDTGLDSYTLFNEHGLLPLGNNVYQKVNANKTFEQAKEIIYQTLQSGNNIIPKSAFKAEYDITDLKNEEFVKEDITNYVNEEIKKIDNNANYDADVLRNMVLFSKYFNTQLNNDKSTPTITGEIDLINNYPQNAEYLKTEFIADFNKKMLKEKVKNSKKYNNFYKHFDISSQGIELINTDPITRREITPYLTDDLVNHFKLKKNGINIVENNDVPIDTSNDIVLRNYYSNYPKALPLYKETYQMDNGTLISNSDKSPFIRVDEGVFEHIETVGNKALYSMLNINDTDFKTYSRSYITPTLGEISKFNITAGVKADKQINNLYSTAQDTEITNEIDNC
jgi:ribosomal protein S18 acetylase RimI-like enzyme